MRPALREAQRCIAVVIWHCKHFTAAEIGERLGAGARIAGHTHRRRIAARPISTSCHAAGERVAAD
jgi:hypothetical protein